MADILTVTELNTEVKNTLTKYYNKQVIVTGEISNFKVAGTSAFFALKDSESKLDGMIFNYNGNNIVNGKQVKVTGTVSLTTKTGTYRILAKQIELVGIGKLHQEYSELKEKYEKLGYFDDRRKKKLKDVKNSIGVITSQDGAALQDFLHVLSKNNYVGNVFIKHSIVQGKNCPDSIVESLKILDEMNLDVIVITRGGGSFEDLFGFSDGKVIDALYNMKTVTMSAIGHQIDFMLSDFVADVRAPTPTSAAELLSCKNENVFNLNDINDIENALRNQILNRITQYETSINTITNNIESLDKIMDNVFDNVEKLCNMYHYKIQNKLFKYSTELNDINILPCENHIILDKNKNIINTIDQFEKFKTKQNITVKFLGGYVTLDISNIKVYK